MYIYTFASLTAAQFLPEHHQQHMWSNPEKRSRLCVAKKERRAFPEKAKIELEKGVATITIL
jgi:hypothetical protein